MILYKPVDSTVAKTVSVVTGGFTKCKDIMPVNKQFSVLLQAVKISLRLFQNFAFDK